MKKFAILVLALGLFLAFTPIAKAYDESQDLLTYTIVNPDNAVLDTNVSTSTIIPGKNRILGFVITPNVSGTGTINAGLWDSASTAGRASTNVFAELAVANTAADEVLFPYPKPLSNGLSVSQGPYSSVIVYYERTKP